MAKQKIETAEARKKFIERYEQLEYLDEGQGLYKALDKKNNRTVMIQEATYQPNSVLVHRHKTAKKLEQHPNIANAYEHRIFNLDRNGMIECLVMEYFQEGNLQDFYSNQQLSDKDYYFITKGILEGLQALHDHKLIHANLKPKNIWMKKGTECWIPKLSGFKSSDKISYYLAPEQEQVPAMPTFKTDTYTFGLTLFELVTKIEIPENFRFNNYYKELQLNININSIFKNIITSCLKKESYRRTITEVLNNLIHSDLGEDIQNEQEQESITFRTPKSYQISDNIIITIVTIMTVVFSIFILGKHSNVWWLSIILAAVFYFWINWAYLDKKLNYEREN